MEFTRRGVMSAGIILGAFAAPDRAFAAPDASFPFRVLYNVPFTSAAIDKHDPLRFLIDTNAFGLTIDTSEAEKMGLAKAPSVNFGSSKFKITQYNARQVLIGNMLMMGPQKLTGFPSRAGDIVKGRLPATTGGPIAIDFDAGRLRFISNMMQEHQGWDAIGSKGPREEGTASQAPAQGAYISATLDGTPLRLRMDTASAGGLVLGAKFVRARGLWDHYRVSVAHKGFAGTSFGAYRLVKAERLEIGKAAFAGPIIGLSDPSAPERAPRTSSATGSAGSASSDAGSGDSGFGGVGGALGAGAFIPQKYDGVIGMELLRRFNVVIDPRSWGVWVSPNSKIADGYHYDRAGVDIQDVDGALQVTDVADGSPAQKAGLKLGDKITAWNGGGGYPGLMWALQGAPGDKIGLNAARDDGPATIEIVLADRL